MPNASVRNGAHNSAEDAIGNQLFISQAVHAYESQILSDFIEHFAVSSVAGILTDGTASARLIIGKSK